MANALERMVTRLVEQLRSTDPGALHRPIAIAELRDTVLPYRLHRGALGLSSSEDYELLVLRLLAEEDGLVRTFPPEAAARAREELASPNPDVDLAEHLGEATIQLGAATVARLDQLGVDQSRWQPIQTAAPPSAGIEAAGEPIEPPPPLIFEVPSPPMPPRPAQPDVPNDLPVFDAIEVTDEAFLAEPEIVEPAVASVPEAPARSLEPAPGPACSACGELLPTHRIVAFCPGCGHQVGVRRCRRCGEEVEKDWRHCVGCGLAVDAVPPVA